MCVRATAPWSPSGSRLQGRLWPCGFGVTASAPLPESGTFRGVRSDGSGGGRGGGGGGEQSCLCHRLRDCLPVTRNSSARLGTDSVGLAACGPILGRPHQDAGRAATGGARLQLCPRTRRGLQRRRDMFTKPPFVPPLSTGRGPGRFTLDTTPSRLVPSVWGSRGSSPPPPPARCPPGMGLWVQVSLLRLPGKCPCLAWRPSGGTARWWAMCEGPTSVSPSTRPLPTATSGTPAAGR